MNIQVKVEKITPAKAQEYLKTNKGNRSIREMAVDEYSSEMEAHRFGVAPDVIAFDTDGVLFNGQHRLLAVIKSKTPIQALVGTGFPKLLNGCDNIFTADVTDAGRKRTVGDQLGRMHKVAHGNIVASAARAIAGICIGFHAMPSFPIGKAQSILAIYQKEIEDTIKTVSRFKPLRRSGVVGTLAFALKLEPQPMMIFMDKLADGDNLHLGDPALALRNHLVTHNVAGGNYGLAWTSEAVGNAVNAALMNKTLIQVKRGSSGIDALRMRQRVNVEKVRAIMGVA